jgi:hypothetical protein
VVLQKAEESSRTEQNRTGAYLPDVMGTGSSSSGGINLDVLMEWYFHQVVQDSVKHY